MAIGVGADEGAVHAGPPVGPHCHVKPQLGAFEIGLVLFIQISSGKMFLQEVGEGCVKRNPITSRTHIARIISGGTFKSRRFNFRTFLIVE
ncbi:hypothetical protein AVHM3334_05260 [Acidovorax sp. SUPP3334]|nr:hypothetical protein AVHM3334_05260 [Acidovorax sp. SUPP3334]